MNKLAVGVPRILDDGGDVLDDIVVQLLDIRQSSRSKVTPVISLRPVLMETRQEFSLPSSCVSSRAITRSIFRASCRCAGRLLLAPSLTLRGAGGASTHFQLGLGLRFVRVAARDMAAVEAVS